MGAKLGFDDCPYNCNNGKIFNYDTRMLEPCPHCSKKRVELEKEGLVELDNGQISSLSSILGVENPYLSSKLVYENLIPEGETVYMEKESLDRQKECLEELYGTLVLGKKPKRSYCFGLGNKGRIDRFVYPLLAKAYLSGLRVGRCISCTEYNRMLLNMSDEIDSFLESDIVIVVISDGSTKSEVSSAKGLMQNRALKGKATIFVTTWSIEACSMLLGYWSEETLFMAVGSFVEYKVSKNKHTRYVSNLTGVENDRLDTSAESQGVGYNLGNLFSSDLG